MFVKFWHSHRMVIHVVKSNWKHHVLNFYERMTQIIAPKIGKKQRHMHYTHGYICGFGFRTLQTSFSEPSSSATPSTRVCGITSWWRTAPTVHPGVSPSTAQVGLVAVSPSIPYFSLTQACLCSFFYMSFALGKLVLMHVRKALSTMSWSLKINCSF